MSSQRLNTELKAARARVTSAQTHYETLGVPTKVDRSGLRRAWMAHTRLFHPDYSRLSEGEAHDLMSKVNGAYAVLSDLAGRRQYDLVNRIDKHEVCPTCRGTGQVSKQRGFARKVWSDCPNCAGEK